MRNEREMVEDKGTSHVEGLLLIGQIRRDERVLIIYKDLKMFTLIIITLCKHSMLSQLHNTSMRSA